MLYLRKSHRSEEKLGQQIFSLRKTIFRVYVKANLCFYLYFGAVIKLFPFFLKSLNFIAQHIKTFLIT